MDSLSLRRRICGALFVLCLIFGWRTLGANDTGLALIFLAIGAVFDDD